MAVSIFRGNSGRINLRATDSEGNPVDLTGYTILFSVKDPNRSCAEDSNDETAVLKGEFTLSENPDQLPQAYFEYTAEDTMFPLGVYSIDTKYIKQDDGIEVNSSSDEFILKRPDTERTIVVVS